jgi:hypothetical protein
VLVPTMSTLGQDVPWTKGGTERVALASMLRVQHHF